MDHFKCIGNVLTRYCYCRREIKTRVSKAKEAFNRKISLLTSKLNIELRKKFVWCYIWSIVLYGSETKKIGAEVFGVLQNVVLEEKGEDKIVREIN